ncbi:hypothetical protein N431DRAFT_434323 [Stipitochalara longipes BDJ]|nr:hypothetical protein N431DRAFT_434323 [Stipitochalara longipes BDJ]
MHLLQVAGLLLSFVMFSSALPELPTVHVAQSTSRANITDFLISGMNLTTSPDNLTSHHTLEFEFIDLNADGNSTICNASWVTTTNGTNTAPMSYVLCEATAAKGFFQWQFSSIINLTSFALRFAHEFSDPVDNPLPWDMVEYFSDANVTLICNDTAGLYCYHNGTLVATVDWLSD